MINNTSSNIEERHQTDPGCTKEDFIDNDLFSSNQRFKPSIVKVAQKTVKINKSESLRLLSTGKLNIEDEKFDVESELEDNNNNNSDQDEYSNKQNNIIIDTEQSEPTENIKDEHLEGENIKHKLELLEKQDEATNISGVKNSISSKEHNSKDVQTPPSSIHENGNDQLGTPNKLTASLNSDKIFSTQSPFQEKTENFDIPEAPEPQKLKSSTYIKENILLNHSLKIKTEESLAKIDSTYQNSYHHKIMKPDIELIQAYTPNKLHTMRDNLNFRALDYYNSYSTTRRKMKELKETPNKLILNNLVARPKNLVSFDELKGSLTRPRPSYSRYIHQLKGDYMQKGNLIVSTNLLSNNKQMSATKYSVDTISSMRPESSIKKSNKTQTLKTSRKIEKALDSTDLKCIETNFHKTKDKSKKKAVQDKRLSSQIFSRKLHSKFNHSPKNSSKCVHLVKTGGKKTDKIPSDRTGTYYVIKTENIHSSNSPFDKVYCAKNNKMINPFIK